MTVITASTGQALIPRTKQYDVTCDLRKGFTIRIQPTGTISYKYRFSDRGKNKLISLPSSYDLAVAEYESLAYSVERHRTISRQRDRHDHSGDLFVFKGLEHLQQQWLKEHVGVNCTTKTLDNYTRYVNELSAAAKGRLNEEVTVIEARKVLREILEKKAKTAPVSSNRMYTALLSMFFWGMKRDLVSSNPLYKAIDKAKETPKSRMLSRDDLSKLLPYLSQCDMDKDKSDALKLILMTGMRSGEVLSITAADVDLEHAQIHLKKTKNDWPFVVALPQLAVDLLRRRVEATKAGRKLFRGGTWGLSQASRRACESVGATVCSAHDYRRTCATMCGQAGVPVATISRILNHAEGRTGTTLKHYALYDMEKEKRAALELVAKKLAELGMRV